MNAATKAAAATGDRTQLDKLARDTDAAANAYNRLNRQLRETNQLASTTTTAFGQVSAATKRWAETTIAALVGIEGVRKVAGIFTDIAKEITEVRNTARAAGLKSGDVQVFTEALRETGESADGSRQALAGLTEKIEQARIKMQGFRAGSAAGVTTLRGGEGQAPGVSEGIAAPFGGVNVIRGSEAALKDVNAVVEKILNNAAKFRDQRKATQSVLLDINQIMKRDAALGAAVGQDLFGRRWGKIAQAVKDLGEAGAWEKIEKELKDSGRWVDPEAEKRVDDFNRAVDDLGDSFTKLKMAIAIPLFPELSEDIRRLADLISRFDEIKAKFEELKTTIGLTQLEDVLVGPIRRAITGFLDSIKTFADTLPGFLAAPLKILVDTVKLTVDAITGDLSGAVRDFGALTKTVFDAAIAVVRGFSDAVVAVVQALGAAIRTVVDAASRAATAVRNLPGTFGAGDMPPMPDRQYAVGGLVPGRGLGDSVRAWLTPGEFVIRRSVVDRLGAGFFASLNRGMGSLLPHNHYATGGFVTGGAGGTPIHLHLDSRQFEVRADQSVAESLMRTARAKQMLSAGRKPSWAGGRRYGG